MCVSVFSNNINFLASLNNISFEVILSLCALPEQTAVKWISVRVAAFTGQIEKEKEREFVRGSVFMFVGQM